MHTVLTIAGSDSGGGAGIQADLKTIAAHGAYGVSILTAVTAQNTRTVAAALPLAPELIEAQFAAIFDDFTPTATKSGMLADRERIEVVGDALRRFAPPHYVLDPVMISKSGYPLLQADAIEALRTHLLPLADVITPNVHEAQLLAGMDIHTIDDARRAGARILDQGPRAVIVKGGHLDEQPGTDVLVTREGTRLYEGEFLESRSTHGTGCTFSSAIAAQLAHGRALEEAIAVAKAYLTEAIRFGPEVGSGAGPTDHFFYLRLGEDERRRWLDRLGVTPPDLAPNDLAHDLAGRGGLMNHVKHIPRLQAITDETVQQRYSHAELAALAARGGADGVQLREKRPWTARALVEAARACLEACEAHDAVLVVDDRADVARAVGAPAIHIGRDDLDAATVRAILGDAAVIGGTANSYEEAARVWTTDIDYIGVGPIYGTRSKANPAADMGLETLRRICADSPVPVVAIGSITAERIAEVMAAGAYGVAVLSAVVSADDPAAAAARCRAALDAALAAPRPSAPFEGKPFDRLRANGAEGRSPGGRA